MPLNKPALSLRPGPRGVQDARRWVVTTFGDIGRDDLVECAEIGVSELVTNALLHGAQPISVRVRGTREHPRVEVRDASTDAPELPVASVDEADELDRLMLTFGRGLSIVSRAADAWGAEIEDDGKVVWFAPAAAFAEDTGPEGRITGTPRLDNTGELPADLTEFVLLDVPVAEHTRFQRHFRELRREIRLLALAHQADYPLAGELSEVFDAMGRPLRLVVGADDVVEAAASGRDLVDITVVMSRRAAAGLGRLVELLDLTDEFCRQERMLSLARTPEQRTFQNWYLGEFPRQAAGEAPQAWTVVRARAGAGPGELRTGVS